MKTAGVALNDNVDVNKKIDADMRAKIRAGRILPLIIKYVILIAFAVFILYPIYLVVISSFKSTADLYQHPFGWPQTAQWVNYAKAWIVGDLNTYYMNSIIITASSLVILVIIASFAAFSITRKDFFIKKFIYFLFVAGISIPYQVGILPLYLQMANMNLVNNRVGMIIIYLAYGLPFSVFVMEGFFRNIPEEVEEAAIVDGCNNFQLYSRIIMPLSPAVIGTVVIFNLVWIWNDMFYPLVFLSSKSLKTIPIGLLSFQGEFISDFPTMFAGVVIASIPMIIMYLLLQRQFVEGLTAGAVKG